MDPDREKRVIEHVKSQSDFIPPEDVEGIWMEIISACKKVQGREIRVAFLGPSGTFTEEAVYTFFPRAGTAFIPAANAWEIFMQIEADKADFGVIPVENQLTRSSPRNIGPLNREKCQNLW